MQAKVEKYTLLSVPSLGGLLCSHFDASRASAKVKRVLCIVLSGAIQEDLLIQNIFVEFPHIDNRLQAMWF